MSWRGTAAILGLVFMVGVAIASFVAVVNAAPPAAVAGGNKTQSTVINVGGERIETDCDPWGNRVYISPSGEGRSIFVLSADNHNGCIR